MSDAVAVSGFVEVNSQPATSPTSESSVVEDVAKDKAAMKKALLDHNRVELMLMNLDYAELDEFSKELMQVVADLRNPNMNEIRKLRAELDEMKARNSEALALIPEHLREHVAKAFEDSENKLQDQINKLSNNKKQPATDDKRAYTIIYNPSNPDQFYKTGKVTDAQKEWLIPLAEENGIDTASKEWLKRLRSIVGVSA